jgi:hypothetical protein
VVSSKYEHGEMAVLSSAERHDLRHHHKQRLQGDGDEIVAQALDSAQGFTIVLLGAKALLEHGVALNLVADKAPYANVNHEATARARAG